MKDGHHLTGKTIYAYHFPNGLLDSKELIPNGAADRTAVRRSIHVLLRKDGTLIHVPALDLEVFWRNAAVGRVPILIAVNHLNRIVHVRRNALDERNLILDGNCIAHDQRFRIVRARAHAVDRTASGFNPDEIIPEIVELLLYTRLPRFADCDDADHRGNPDGDPQDRQNASHLVSEQRH